ncbi:MAG: hypothetical protein ABIO55_08465 [Ginsengibacter sp.]
MKQILTLITLAVVLLVSCKKSATNNTSFIGKWKLVKTLADPGDGSGQWQSVPAGDNKFIQFNNDESLESNVYTEFNKYRIIDSVRIDFLKADGHSYWFRYKINASSLEINPPCIEACGARFIKE